MGGTLMVFLKLKSLISKAKRLKNLKALPIYCNCMEIPALRTSPFVFHREMKVIQVWKAVFVMK